MVPDPEKLIKTESPVTSEWSADSIVMMFPDWLHEVDVKNLSGVFTVFKKLIS